MQNPTPRLRIILGICAIVALTLIAYLPAVTSAGFIWDDDSYVTGNQVLRSLDGLRQIWIEPRSIPQYYPLVHTSFWIEYHLWELDPRGYHIVNVLLHVAVALLVWRMLRLLSVPGAWLAAAVFAVHPVHVESVAWITERKNVLSGLFYLLAMLSYLRFAGINAAALLPVPVVSAREDRGRSGRAPRIASTGQGATKVERRTARPHEPSRGAPSADVADPPRSDKAWSRWPWYAAALALFVAALLSKTVTCSLPAALLLILWWKQPRLGWRDVLPTLPMFALGLAAARLTTWLEAAHVGATGKVFEFSVVERCLIAGRALWFYAAKLIAPFDLSFIYERWTIDSHEWWQWIYPLAALGVIASVWLLRDRIGKGPLVAMLLFAGTLVPALGFFSVFPMRFSFVADHFQYLASIALIALMAAAGARWLSRPGLRAPAIAVTAVIIGALTALTWTRCLAFQNLETLWRDTTEKNETGWLPWNNLGALLANQGRIEEAAVYYEQALRNDPTYGDTYVNLAQIRLQQGDVAAAQRLYEECLRYQPGWVVARSNLANILASQGRIDEAIGHYQAVIAADPSFVDARVGLARLLLQRGQGDDAVRHLREALRFESRMSPPARVACAELFFVAGQFREAGALYEKVVAATPDNANALRMMGFSLMNQKRHAEAVPPLERSLELEPGNADAISALARLYAELGRPDDAARMQRQVPKK